MSFLRKIFRINPKKDFERGKKAFKQKNYILALEFFKNAYKRFKHPSMKISSLENAA